MSWLEMHKESEMYASAAHAAKKENNLEAARSLFVKAGASERHALELIDPREKPRTFAITAVSATSLYYKGGDLRQAEILAYSCLANEHLSGFAADQLRDILQSIWNEQAQAEANVQFAPGQVSVTVDGGEIVRGGAPLDLILEKVQIVQAIFFRTAEFLKEMPLRKRGAASKDIQEMCRPWLFQGVPGSYQFVVAIEGPSQLNLFPGGTVQPELIASTFMNILEKAVEDPDTALAEAIPDPDYRSTFLKLTRNLAPTGRAFDKLQIRATDSVNPLILTSDTRKELSYALMAQRQAIEPSSKDKALKGVLRAVHLDDDWLEVYSDNQLVRIKGVGEAVDDLIGPMVNHEVIVHTTAGPRGSLKFIDIEAC